MEPPIGLPCRGNIDDFPEASLLVGSSFTRLGRFNLDSILSK